MVGVRMFLSSPPSRWVIQQLAGIPFGPGRATGNFCRLVHSGQMGGWLISAVPRCETPASRHVVDRSNRTQRAKFPVDDYL